MKTLSLTLIFLIMALCALHAQRGQETVSWEPIPLPNVLNKPGTLNDFIKQKCPGFVITELCQNVTKGKGNNTYEIKLTGKGDIKRTLIYNQNGSYYKYGVDKISLTPIQLPNVLTLPGPMPDFLRQNYPDFIITEAFEVVSANNLTTYELGIEKGNREEKLTFDKNGKLLGKKVLRENQQKKNVSTVRR